MKKSPLSCPGRRALLAVAALGLVIGLVLAVEIWVRVRLRSHLEPFGDRMSPAKLSGNVLDRRAFDTPGFFPIFGSSELNRPAGNRPDEFFRRRPTGFTAFTIGRGGTSCLLITQKIAAVGAAARGRKVAIILSPSWFLKDRVSLDAVRGNLAPLQLGSWIFGGSLSDALKGRIARRLLEYPGALDRQPLLAMALESLARSTPASRLRLAALTPVGVAQNLFLERIDYCALLREIVLFQNRRALRREESVSGPGPGASIPWDALAARAAQRDRERGNGNQYSVGAPTLEVGQKPPKEHGKKKALTVDPPDEDAMTAAVIPPMPQKPSRDRDTEFFAELAKSREWTDLGLLLSTLKELGAQAFFISQPFNGIYRDLNGNSASARRAYYDKLHAAIDPTGFPLLDFSEHEEDRFFFNDTGHPSSKAWIYYDHALADFYGSKSG